MKRNSLNQYNNIVSLLCIMLTIFVHPFIGEAQECDQIFSHLSIAEGLSANHVKAIVRDRDGFLWIGTTNGLNRYDGASVKS